MNREAGRAGADAPVPRVMSPDALRGAEALDAVPAMVWIADENQRGLFFNAQWLRFRGRAMVDECGEGWMSGMYAQDRSRVQEHYAVRPHDASTREVEYRLQAADGAYRWVLESATPCFEAGRFRGYIGACVDIHDRRQREDLQRESEDVFRALAEAMPALVLTTNPDGSVQFCNERLLAYCGATLEHLQESGWLEYVHPDDAESGRDAWSARVTRLEPFAMEYRIRRQDGAYRWHQTHIGPLLGSDGQVRAWVSVSVDVDDLRRAERQARLTAEQLQRANAAKDEFLGLISHELRTPLTTIYGNAQILQRFGSQLETADLNRSLADIEQEAYRLQLLIDNMFVLARSGSVPRALEPVLLSRAVARIVEHHRARFPDRRVDISDEVGVWPIRGDASCIEHVVRNLLSNAEKHSPPDQPIVVALDRSETHAAVRVLDRGPGVEDADIGRLFDTFYRSPKTADRLPGAGIGLSVCKQLVEAQGGDIWFRLREDGGSEAGFTLPLEDTEVLDEE